jgi:hypothetical protein
MIRVLFDDREQVAEEAAFGLRELRTLDRQAGVRILNAVDGRARRWDQRR